MVGYSAEHVKYEFEMFLWLGQVCGNPAVKIAASGKADVICLNNALIEAFAVHVRNVIDFLYLEDPKPTDVVAADFLDPGVWRQICPDISPSLSAARKRANKEIAHLTTDRIAGSPPEKGWDFRALVTELKPLLQFFATKAPPTRCSQSVAAAVC